MKANRKFLRGDDEAVSPVIAVILMVAITVVLAATVYVWVSGFGSQSSTPAKTISLTSGGALKANATHDYKNYTVASSTPGMKYTDVSLTLEGVALSCNDAVILQDTFRVWSGGSVASCSGSNGPDRVVAAGDTIEVYDNGNGLSGKTLRVLDSQANSVILTLAVG